MKPLESRMPQRVRMRPWGQKKLYPTTLDKRSKTLMTLSPSPTLPPQILSPILHPLTRTKPRQHHPSAGRGCSRTPAHIGAPTAPHPHPQRVRLPTAGGKKLFPAHSDKFLAVRAALQPPGESWPGKRRIKSSLAPMTHRKLVPIPRPPARPMEL